MSHTSWWRAMVSGSIRVWSYSSHSWATGPPGSALQARRRALPRVLVELGSSICGVPLSAYQCPLQRRPALVLVRDHPARVNQVVGAVADLPGAVGHLFAGAPHLVCAGGDRVHHGLDADLVPVLGQQFVLGAVLRAGVAGGVKADQQLAAIRELAPAVAVGVLQVDLVQHRHGHVGIVGHERSRATRRSAPWPRR